MDHSPLSASDGTADPVDSLVQWFEQLTPGSLSRLDAYYAPDAHFKDPFNDVRGVAAITQVFEHMFAVLERPRFAVTQRIVQGRHAMLGWEFHFRIRRRGKPVDQCIRGVSVLHFDGQGRVALHRDYWDAAEELYEKLPVLGRLMRWLRRMMSATA